MAGTKLSDPWYRLAVHSCRSNISATVMLNHREVTDILVTQQWSKYKFRPDAGPRNLSVIPRSFTLDEQTGLRSPQGMSGNKLLAHVHVITGASYVIQNLKKCLKLAGLEAAVLVRPHWQSVSWFQQMSENWAFVSLISVWALPICGFTEAHLFGCKSYRWAENF